MGQSRCAVVWAQSRTMTLAVSLSIMTVCAAQPLRAKPRWDDAWTCRNVCFCLPSNLRSMWLHVVEAGENGLSLSHSYS
ncbi:hypothetical protein F5883DRAFT_539775 [Diaporthe sp. PMI_573]|nr:hypothetical protein F5883DRAFT_539775 [Diaporthaceae sp. PMI_573]